jgi:hypothetical protein
MKSQIVHRLRCIGQYLKAPSCGIVGGYHLGNLGDMALGEAISNSCRLAGISHGLQTLYNLESWKLTQSVIIGGGAVTQRCNLERALERVPVSRLALCGVDIEDWDALNDYADRLSKIPYFSVRSTAQAIQARDLGLHDVAYHPDNVFSLRSYISIKKIPSTSKNRRLVLNISPRFHRANPDSVCDDDILACPVPFSVLRDNYTYLLRSLVARCVDEGYNIEHIPFTPSDHHVASLILSGLPVRMRPYCPNPAKIIAALGDDAVWIASRYHSLIFSILGLHPVLPIAYADKSVRLLRDLRVDQSSIVDLRSLTSRASVDTVLDRDIPSVPLLDGPCVDRLSFLAIDGISTALASLGLLGSA